MKTLSEFFLKVKLSETKIVGFLGRHWLVLSIIALVLLWQAHDLYFYYHY
jgi:hypothetical protein